MSKLKIMFLVLCACFACACGRSDKEAGGTDDAGKNVLGEASTEQGERQESEETPKMDAERTERPDAESIEESGEEPTKAPNTEPTDEPLPEVTDTPVIEGTEEPITEASPRPILPAVDIVEGPVPEGVWIPEPAPSIRYTFSEEEKLAEQNRILEKGTFLFGGKTDQGYYPYKLDWLHEADPEDTVALIYACDDLTHGGWGVLGFGASVGGKYANIIEVTAMSDNPAKERLLLYTIEEILAAAGVEEATEIKTLSLGAWNGGRIAGLYFLPGETAEELTNYLALVEKTEEIMHTYTGELSNKNAIENAKTLYNYLKETYGKACLTGQMESTWMGSPEYEMDYILEYTGKLPAIRGLDFMHNDFEGVTKRALEWWEKGGIPTICWHTGADFASAYNESKDDNINWDEAFVAGSETYNALIAGMDRAVPYLQQLEDAGVPVLWRPFHELDGGWFWWSKGGSENFVKLWQLMYSRYTDYWGLDNLIWVFGYSGNGGEMAAWYPGDAYVDLLGADSYTPGPSAALYEECVSVAPEGMPVVYHECGTIPTADELKEAKANWLFFMTWHTDWLTNTETSNTIENLQAVYNSDYFITLDELPAFQ